MIRPALIAIVLFGMASFNPEANGKEFLYFRNDTTRPMNLKVYSYSAHRWRPIVRFAPGYSRYIYFDSNVLYHMSLEDDRGVEWPLGPYNITTVRQKHGKYLEIRISAITKTCMEIRYVWSPQLGAWIETPTAVPSEESYSVGWYRWRRPIPEQQRARTEPPCPVLPDCWCPHQLPPFQYMR